ncbi:MAG: hypothetical protein JZU65_11950 [Chlorobium sp.]|nr:hypothetical protein [Chlorobium sp.]
MRKRTRTLLAFLAGILFLSLGVGPSLAANKNEAAQSLHKDGSAISSAKQNRITQAQRQAAADRAKAKGLEAPKVEAATPGDTTQTERGAKK